MKKIMVDRLKPLAGYVLVEPAEKDIQTESGIILPVDKTEKPQYGKILALGEAKCDCQTDKGCNCNSVNDLQVGDTVIYKKWGGNDFKIDDVEYQFLKYDDILAKID